MPFSEMKCQTRRSLPNPSYCFAWSYFPGFVIHRQQMFAQLRSIQSLTWMEPHSSVTNCSVSGAHTLPPRTFHRYPRARLRAHHFLPGLTFSCLVTCFSCILPDVFQSQKPIVTKQTSSNLTQLQPLKQPSGLAHSQGPAPPTHRALP